MKLLLFFPLFLFAFRVYSLPLEVDERISLSKAIELYSTHQKFPLKVGVHDVSFLGCKTILSDLIVDSRLCPTLKLLSPHGTAVVQIMKDPIYGVNPQMDIAALTTGIFEEDMREAVKSWKKKGIKLVNLSMSFRSKEIVDILNDFILDGGIIIASSGNSRLRLGEEPKEYYKDFKGILVGASNTFGAMEEFSQYLPGKTILAPGTIDLYPVERLVWTGSLRDEPTELDQDVKIKEYRFGMTSSSSPVVAGVVSMALELNPELTQSDINELLLKSADIYDGKPILNAEKFIESVLEK